MPGYEQKFKKRAFEDVKAGHLISHEQVAAEMENYQIKKIYLNNSENLYKLKM